MADIYFFIIVYNEWSIGILLFIFSSSSMAASLSSVRLSSAKSSMLSWGWASWTRSLVRGGGGYIDWNRRGRLLANGLQPPLVQGGVQYKTDQFFDHKCQLTNYCGCSEKRQIGLMPPARLPSDLWRQTCSRGVVEVSLVAVPTTSSLSGDSRRVPTLAIFCRPVFSPVFIGVKVNSGFS